MKHWSIFASICLVWGTFAERLGAQSSACGLIVDAGPDVVACAPAGQVTLQGQLSGPVLSFAWQPAAGLNDPQVLQPQAFVSGPTSWTLVATTLDLSANAITNGDFEQGNTAFTSDYNFNATNLAFDGNYTVISSPSIVYANFPPCVDHTSGSGQMMVVNGGSTPGDRVWCQTVNVMPNTEYVFSAWVSNINPLLGLPELQLQIEGQLVGSLFTPPATPCNWVEWSESWTSGSATTVEVCILSQSTAPFGNDFALDDIGLYPVCEVSDVVQADLVAVQAVAPGVVFMPCNAQGAGGIVLDGSASSSGQHISYQWTTSNGSIVAGVQTAQVTVNEPGTYLLTVTYDDGLTTCTAQAVTTVLLDPNQPFVLIAPPDTITCAQPVVQLDATNATTGPNYQYEWQALSGNIASGGQTLTPLVDQPGTYALTITNTANGCSAMATVNVFADTLHPEAVIAPPDTLGCGQHTVWLDGGASSGQALQFQWQALSGNIASDPYSSAVLADQPGGYRLVLTDTMNGCTDTALVEVALAADAPQAAILPPDTLTCLSANVTLTAMPPAGDSITWTWLDAEAQPIGGGQLVLDVDTAGWYGFAVQDTTTGCGDTVWVEVIALQSPPTLSWLPPKTRTCTDTAQWLSAQVDASVEVQWHQPDGQLAFGDSLWTSQAGVFVLVATDPATGCADTGLLFVPVDTVPPVLALNTPDPLTCLDTVAVLSLTTDADTSWWVGPDGTVLVADTIESSLAGLWHAWVQDSANGCVATDTVHVHDLRQWPVVQGSGLDALTCAEPAGWLVAELNGSVPDVELRWWTASGQLLATGNDSLQVDSSGTYLIEAVHLPSGCSASDTLLVGLDTLPPPLALTPPDTLTCLVQSALMQANAGSHAHVQWFDTAGTLLAEGPDWMVSEASTFIAQAVDSTNGCVASSMFEVVVVRDTPQVQLVPLDTLDCHIDSVPLEVSGTWPGATVFWLWTPNDTIGPVGASGLVATQPGWHTLRARAPDSGCEAIDSAFVHRDTMVPTIALQGMPLLTCTSSEAVLSWSGQADTLTLIAPQGPPLAVPAGDTALLAVAGWWQLQATGDNGCVFDSTLFVGVDTTSPALAPTYAQPLTCAHPETALQASAMPEDGVGYQWTGPSGQMFVGWQVTVDVGGEWQVFAQDSVSGCTASDTLWLPSAQEAPQVLLLPVDTLAPPCVPDSVLLEAIPLQDGLTFAWAGPSAAIAGDVDAPAVFALSAGTYSLVVTDTLSGCTWDTTLTVAQHASDLEVELFGESQIDCTTPEGVLVAWYEGNGLLGWHTPDGHFVALNADTAVVDAPGTYVVQLTDAFGCSASDTLVISASFEAPQLVLPDSLALGCAPSEAWLEPLVAGPDSVSFEWWRDGMLLPQTEDSLQVTEAGTYVLVATNVANGCQASDSTTVWLDTLGPVVSAGVGGTITCAQPFVHLQGTVSGGTGPLEVHWLSPKGVVLPPMDSLDVWATAAGAWTIIASNPQNGCTATDTALVLTDTLSPQFALLPFGNITCSVPEVTLALSEPAPELAATWIAPDGTAWSGLALATSQDGPWLVQVADLDNGCTDSLHFTVELDTLRPQVDAGPDRVLDCVDGQASAQPHLVHAGPVQIAWTGPEGGLVSGAAQLEAVFAKAGVYVLEVRDSVNGCTATDSLTVTESAPTSVFFHLRQPDCLDTLGELFIDSVAGGLQPYAFSLDGGPFALAGWFPDLAPGTHQLRVEDASGCALDTTFVLDEVVRPSLSLIGPIRIELGDSVVLAPVVQPPDLAFAKIRWQPDLWLSCADCLQPVVRPEAEGQFFYNLSVETSQHCRAEATIMLRVFFQAPVYVPNVFSPNGDGDNDVLVPMAEADEVLRITEFAIYDRWGDLMHLARDFPPGDAQGGWRGLVGQQQAPPAVYLWRLRVLLANGKEVTLHGDLLLIR